MKKQHRRIKPVSAKRKAALASYKKTRLDWLTARSQPGPGGKLIVRCEAPGCGSLETIKAITIHHKRGRIGALLCDTRHWSALCLSCHNQVGESPEWARRVGLLCEKGLWNTPDRTPNGQMD